MQVQRLNVFLYWHSGNVTHELMVFKFSYLSNNTVHFDESVTYYVK